MKKQINQITLFTLILFFVSFVLAIFSSETLLTIIPSEFIKITRVASYITAFITIIITFLLLALVLYITWLLNMIFEIDVDILPFLEGVRSYILVVLAGQVLKFILMFIFLGEDISNLTYSKELADQLANTNYFKIIKITDYIFWGLACISFAMTLKDENVPIRKVIIVSTFMVVTFSLAGLLSNLGG